MSDERALRGLKDLDRQVIGEIYDQYFSEVYRYAYSRLGETAHAEDVASEVFLRLVESAQSGKPPRDNLKGWLIGTASHLVADQYRKKYRRPEESISEEMPDQRAEPAAEVAQREQQRAVKQAYQKLTPEQQEVITLRFQQGYSLEETASFMRKNINAIKALQLRALAALSREMGEVNYE